MRGPGFFTTLLVLLTLGFPATALEDPREEYTVEVTAFRSLGLPREHRYLASTLPRLMLHTLSSLETHRFSGDETADYRRRLVLEARRKSEIALFMESDEASESFLRRRDAAAGADPLAKGSVDKREEALQEYNRLAVYTGADISIPDEKPLRVLTEPGEFSPPPESPADYCRKRQLDLLISGRIEALGEIVYFSLTSYSFASGEWEEIYSSASGFASLEEVLAEAGGSLRRRVLGRDWSILSVQTDRRDARIFVDNKLEGLGQVTELLLDPGEHRIRIESASTETEEETVGLAQGEELSREFTLVPKLSVSLGLTSQPSGADVYLSSRWVGQTPLFLPPGADGTLRLSLDGYRELLLPVDELDDGKTRITLEKNLYDYGAFFQAKRDKLYTAVGLFTLSLPATMFSYALYRDYQNQAALLGEDELADRAFLYNGLFYGTLYGSTVLFVHLVRSLAEYRKAGARGF